MTEEDWLAVLSRISSDQPLDLDSGMFDASAEKPSPARHKTVSPLGGVFDPPSARLWDQDTSGRSYLGVRVTSALPDCAYIALRLAAAAAERGVIPIILTTLSNSGFERFGFRVERLPSGPAGERAAYEDELSRFWNMAIIIDAAEVALVS